MALRISYNLEDITYFNGEMFCELMITEGNKQERQSQILTLPFLKLTLPYSCVRQTRRVFLGGLFAKLRLI